MPRNPFEPATPEDLATQEALGQSASGLELLRAHVDRVGGEHRPQQEQMLTAVEDSIRAGEPLIVQAGTGTGKSLAYAFAAAASGKRSIIATATNQLGEQLASKDLPMVADLLGVTGKDLPVALLKGRNNYLCKMKVREMERLDAQAPGDTLFDLPSEGKQLPAEVGEIRALMEWADETRSGDRSEAPAVSQRTWRQVSVSGNECVGSDCPFYDECFTEVARRRARMARVVLTNHSMLAQDIRLSLQQQTPDAGESAQSLLGPAPVVIVDEAHSLAQAVTDALSVVVDPAEARKVATKADMHISDRGEGDKGTSRSVTSVIQALDDFQALLESAPTGPLLSLDEAMEDALTELANSVVHLARKLLEAENKATLAGKPNRALAARTLQQQMADIAEAILDARSTRPGTVRWVAESGDRRQLCVAPIEIGHALQEWVNAGERTLIATSATLAVGGSFEPVARTLGMADAATLDVGTPFSYREQGMLYIPGPPFPEPVGRDRREHTERVLAEVERLVAAAGGRSLLLFTTTAGAIRAAEHLRGVFPGLRILGHGDAPADVLVENFRDDETSVLCATMGLWHGVDVPGASCSLVVVDKIPFAPMDDALSAARRAAADEEGRNGFTEVFVADAAIDLAQAAGRLIRQAGDRGVVAILDPRIHSKGYGRLLLESLPDFGRYRDADVVLAALERLTGGLDPAARTAKPKRSGAGKPKSGTPRKRAGSGPRKAPPRRAKRPS